jgi:glutamyl-tRNA synthetase, bacterial family
MMHIGNLRTALYEYLIAKSAGGDFILRIEDTDQDRYKEGAEEAIYKALRCSGLKHDEGPDIGGEFGPYVQSQRKDHYLPYAKKLVEDGKAYYCFCTKERLESLKNEEGSEFSGYDRKCRNLDEETVNELLSKGTPYVIRQKMPIDGSTVFHDEVFGDITVENKELQDQILIKADGFPTYNFANVIDDHEMQITDVVRGCEYLSSTPKYNLLYEAFGWPIPSYVHLPLIMGKNEDGSIAKLSKRHGSVGFEDLLSEGYLPEAIINYIALLGWCPEGSREIFSLEELTKEFSVSRISKSPSVFDYDKLEWFNGEYLRNEGIDKFLEHTEKYIKQGIKGAKLDIKKIASVLHQRVTKLTQIPDMIDFLAELPEYDKEIFINKKSKTNLENSLVSLKIAKEKLENLKNWDYESIHELLLKLAEEQNVKNGTLMWPIRIAISGKKMTPGGAIEILDILGKEEALKRIEAGIKKLENE